MWDMARKLGYRGGGTVLEPAAGIGHFLGLMPADLRPGTQTLAVELDAMSARITRLLYPRTTVFQGGFQSAPIKPGSVDLIITNVPFDSRGPVEARVQVGMEMNLHNYFLARALQMLKPGGLLLAITTHFTMDANTKQREQISRMGDLVAAVRLPNNAFKENAGTEVTTDILVFRKPDGLQRFADAQPFAKMGAIAVEGGGEAPINEYFVAHPDKMLGIPSLEGTMRGGKDEFTLQPQPGAKLEEQIAAVVESLPENVFGTARTEAVDYSRVGEATGYRDGDLHLVDGQLVLAEEGKFVDPMSALKVGKGKNAAAAERVRATAYVSLRDQYTAHLNLMATHGVSEEEVEVSRKQLKKSLEAYTKKFGNVSRGGTKGFWFDSGYYRVKSMENVQEHPKKTGRGYTYTYTWADVVERRTVWPATMPESAETPADALVASINFRGGVDPEYMANLVGAVDPEAMMQSLEEDGRVYNDPVTSRWELAELYLAGNVREKLRAAEHAAETFPRYQKNVEALRKVIPETVPIGKAGVKLGARWIPANVMERWVKSAFNLRGVRITYSQHADGWSVVVDKHEAARSGEYVASGTAKRSVADLLEDMLNIRTTKVFDTKTEHAGGGRVEKRELNVAETQAAKSARERLQQRFRLWVLEEQTVADELESIFNEQFNSVVHPKWDGSHLTLPGSAQGLMWRAYQKTLVWRMMNQGGGMIAHGVGSGKTWELIALSQELKRTGQAKKPMIVVQNSTLEQFATTFRQLYPMANILVGSKDDLSGPNRNLFAAKIAAGDWDCIIMPQSSFALMPTDPKRMEAFIRAQVIELENAIREEESNARQSRGRGQKTASAKMMAAQKKALEDRLKDIRKRVAERQDSTVYFEQIGVDALLVDEAHAYKKVPFTTRLDSLVGLDKGFSERGFDMLVKARFIQDRNRGRGVFLATGTPMTNTLGEAWHMLNLASPETLREWNVDRFDKFVGAFAEVEQVLEMNAGMKWVFKDALSKWTNAPELSTLIRSQWDIFTGDELRAYLDANEEQKMPDFEGGNVETVAVVRSEPVGRFIEWIEKTYERFSRLSGLEKRANTHIPLLLYMAARTASIDIRLVEPRAPDDPGSKVNVMVDKAAALYKESTTKRGVQLIFCDLANRLDMSKLRQFNDMPVLYQATAEDAAPATESGDYWLYEEIRRKLIDRGVPRSEIVLINEVKDGKARESLFNRVNSGEVRFLIGGTEKMGTGVNVQERVRAIHHLDAVWLPASLEQRNGRGIRFGNIFKSVKALSYGMEKTLDAAIWAKVLRKVRMIGQFLGGKIVGREFDDPFGAVHLSAQEQMAAYAGDPLVFRRLELENEVRILEMEQEAWDDQTAKMASDYRRAMKNAEYYRGFAEKGRTVAERAEALRTEIKEKMVVVVGGKTFNEQAKAGKALDEIIQSALNKVPAQLKSEGKSAMGQLELESGLWGENGNIRSEVKENAREIAHFTLNGIEVGVWVSYAHIGDLKNPTMIAQAATRATAEGISDPVYVGSATHGSAIITQVLAGLGKFKEHMDADNRASENAANEAAALLPNLERPFPKAELVEQRKEKLLAIRQELAASSQSHAANISPDNDEATSPQVRADTGKGALAVSPQDVERAFPGAHVVATGKKWEVLVTLPNGAKFRVRWEKDLAVSMEEIRREHGDLADNPEAIVAGHWAFYGPKGGKRVSDGLGVLSLLMGEADHETLRHERVHVAHSLGLFTKQEWDTLVAAFAPGETDPARQEGMIAQRAEESASLTARGFWKKVKDFLAGLFRLASGPSADAILAKMGESSFWARPIDLAMPEPSKKAQLRTRKYGRPDLANPGTTEEARRQIDDWDEARNLGGRPELKPHMEARRKAAEYLRNVSAESARSMILNAIKEHGFLEPWQTVVAMRLDDQGAIRAVRGVSEAEALAYMRFHEAYREVRGDTARSLSIAVDPLKTPAERAATALQEIITTPSPADAKALRHLDAEIGKASSPQEINKLRKQKDAIIARMAREIGKLRELLATRGFDLGRIEDILANPDEAYRMIDEATAGRARFTSKMVEFWKAGLLSFSMTHVRNLAGNTANSVWEYTVQRFAEAVVNLAVGNKDAAQFGEFKHLLLAMKPGFVRGVRNLLASWRTERPMFEDEIAGSTAAGNRAIDSHRAAVGGAVGRKIRIPFRALLAADEFQKSIIGEMEAAAVAYRVAKGEGLAGAALQSRMNALVADTSSVAWARGLEKAIDLTFQRDMGVLGQKALEVRDAAWILHFLAPFIKTNVNIYKFGLRRFTPLGAIYAGYRVASGDPSYTRQTAVRDLAEAFVSMGITFGLMGLLGFFGGDDDDPPWITGSMPYTVSNRGERDLAYRTVPPQHIRLPGTDIYIGYGETEPMATGITTIVDALNNIRAAKDGKEMAAATGAFWKYFVDQSKDKTFMRGIGDLVNLLEDESFASHFAANFAASWMPNIVRGTARATDPFVRETRLRGKGGDWWRRYKERIQYEVAPYPGAGGLMPRVDLWGREIVKRPHVHPATDFGFRLFSPVKAKSWPDDRPALEQNLDRMIANWNNQNPNDVWAPEGPSWRYGKRGDEDYWSPGEYHELSIRAGQLAIQALERHQHRLDFDNPTPEQVKFVRGILDRARSAARAEMLRKKSRRAA